MKHIELFAGCGGLCLGLSKAGFSLYFANELSPMAAETFAYNILGEDLQTQSTEPRKTLWLSSKYDTTDFHKRLREDPREFPIGTNCELSAAGDNLEGSLVVGNVWHLNDWIASHPEVQSRLLKEDFDLVSGGPPCQSFSLAGLREKNNAKNNLPWAFANFVKLTQPKIVLLENVSGILRPFTEGGKNILHGLKLQRRLDLSGMSR